MRQKDIPRKRTRKIAHPTHLQRYKKTSIFKLRQIFVLLAGTRYPIKEIANIVGKHQSNVRRAFYKLCHLGLITKDRKLTPEGRFFLDFGGEILFSKMHTFRLHNLQFLVKTKEPITHDIYDKVEKVFHLDNVWTAGYTTFSEFSIRKARVRLIGGSNTICIYLPEIVSISPQKAKETALNLLWSTIKTIEEKLNIEVFKTAEMPITVGSQHIALMNEPLAKAFIKAGIKLRVEDINGQPIVIIDDSKGYKELEFVNRQSAEVDIAKIRDFYFDITRNNAWQKQKEEIERLKKEIELLKNRK